MTTTRQQRSPMGAFYRTPMGAFGPGVAPVLEDLAIVTGFVTNARDFQRYRWAVVLAECRLDVTIEAGSADAYRTELGINGIDPSTPIPPAEGPTIAQLWDYVFIGQTGGARFKPSDFVPLTCSSVVSPTAGFSVGGGDHPAPALAITGYPEVGPGTTNAVNWYSPTTAGHPTWDFFETVIGYPADKVPP